VANQGLDINTPVAERTAFFVRFGNLGLERNYAFETRLKVGHALLLLPVGAELAWSGAFWAPMAAGFIEPL
jgi:hypothetical protein